jgi:hypothetical protein
MHNHVCPIAALVLSSLLLKSIHLSLFIHKQ